MKLGFLTPYSQERAQFARAKGFTCLELQTGPGAALDTMASDDDLKKVKDVLDRNEISVSAVAYHTNHLEEGRKKNVPTISGALSKTRPNWAAMSSRR